MKTRSRLLTMLVVGLMATANSPIVAADHDVMAKFDRVDVGAGHPVTGHAMHYEYGFKGTHVNGLHLLVNVPVPSNLLGFDTLSSALDSEIMVTFTRGRHLYAECTMQASRSFGLLGSVSFEMDIMKIDGEMLWRGGTCNITPWAGKDTVGIPEVIGEDWARAYVFLGPGKMPMITSGVARPM